VGGGGVVVSRERISPRFCH